MNRPFTIWTDAALLNVELATTAEGRTYGVAGYGEIWFRFLETILRCHERGGNDATAWMERRGS